MHGSQANGAIACISRAFLRGERLLFNTLYARHSDALMCIARANQIPNDPHEEETN